VSGSSLRSGSAIAVGNSRELPFLGIVACAAALELARRAHDVGANERRPAR